jgi:amino acid adenylation domain-containing protein
LGVQDKTIDLSDAQLRIWFECKSNEENAAYSNPFSFRLEGVLDVAAFARALEKLISKHEALRTYIIEVDGRPYAKVLPTLAFGLSVIDLSVQKSALQVLKKEIASLSSSPFNLNQAPLFKVALFKISQDMHVFYFNLHHLIIDGVSFEYLLEDLSALYNGQADLQTTSSMLEKKIVKELHAEQYWIERLKGANFETTLPAKSSGIKEGAPSQFLRFAFTQSESSSIMQFLKENSVSLFQFIMTITAILVHEYTLQRDLVFGYSINTRTKNDRRLVGCFVNALPFRVPVVEEESLNSLLQKVVALRRQDRAHQDTPLTEIITSLRQASGANLRKLFDILINERTYFSYQLNLQGVQCKIIPLTRHIAKNDITILFDCLEKIVIELEYDCSKFSKKMMHYFFENFIFLCKRAVQVPHLSIRAILDQSLSERPGFMEIKGERLAYPDELTLVHLFKTAATHNKNAIALVFQNQQITYVDLDLQSDRMAAYLHSIAIKENGIVAVCLDRSFEMIISILAILKVGGAYLPIEPDTPIERVQYMLSNSAAKKIILKKGLRLDLEQLSGDLALFFDANSVLKEAPKTSFATLKQDASAYLIYTSGSTGLPKGALNTHQGAVNRILWMKKELDVKKSDVFLLKTPYSFDVSVWEIFLPLVTGAKLVIAPPGGHKEPLILMEHVLVHQVNIIHFVPSMLKVMLELECIEKMNSLRAVICSGEVLDKSIVRQFHRKNDAVLYNFYGPTEASIDVTFWRCQQKAPHMDIPIGYPIDNVHLYILDENMRLVPFGVDGELYIGGLALAKGYINNPLLTEKSFIFSPFEKGARLYKTGDRVRLREDGAIAFLGRLDRQIKLRGFRIELNEIEACILAYANIIEAAVIVKEHYSQRGIMAFVVSSSPLNVEQLQRHLERYLPAYMIPQWVQLNALPKLVSGKIDYKRLANNEIVASSGQLSTSVSPDEDRSQKVQLMKKLWVKVLKVDQIKLDDNFFALGGNSLNVMELLFFIKQSFHLEIRALEFFNYPTIAGLLAFMTGLSHKKKLTHKKNASLNLNALSAAEERIWFMQALCSASPFYSMPRLFKIQGVLDLAQLELAVDKLLSKHVLLSAYFPAENGIPIRKMDQLDQKTLVHFFDLSHFEIAQAEIRAREAVACSIRVPFDLAKPPLFRFELFKLNETSYYFLVNLHHIICDNWSLHVLLCDLGRNYQYPDAAYQVNAPYADYVAMQRELSSNQEYKRLLKSWAGLFSTFPQIIAFPLDRIRPKIEIYKGALYRSHISKSMSQKIKLFCKKNEQTFFTFLFAAFAVLIQKYSGQDRFILGTTIANRRDPQYEDVVGLFANTVPIPCEIIENETFLSLLSRFQKTIADLCFNQDFPFEGLIRELNVNRSLNVNPLFQIALVLLTKDEDQFVLPAMSVEKIAIDPGVTKFDFTLYFEDKASGMELTIEYNSAILNQSTMKEFAHAYSVLMSQIVDKMYGSVQGVDVRVGRQDLDFPGGLIPLLKKTDMILDAVCQLNRCYYVPQIISVKDPSGLNDWKNLYDVLYHDSDQNSTDQQNIVGWNSSFDGRQFSYAEIEDWLLLTANNIKRFKPQRILELGFGTGLLLSKLQDSVIHYTGVDPSIEALKIVKKKYARSAQIDLIQAYAHEWDKIPKQNYDMIVFNSSIQYFPDFFYLLAVLREAVHCLREGGKIYLGDIRNWDLAFPFYAAIETFNSEVAASVGQIKAKSFRRMAKENELLVSPRFFELLKQTIPEIKNVEFMSKVSSQYDSELFSYRYDCVLHISTKPVQQKKVFWADAATDFVKKPVLGFRDVLAPTLADQKRIVDWLSGHDQEASDVFYKINAFAKQNGLSVKYSPAFSGRVGCVDVVLTSEKNKNCLLDYQNKVTAGELGLFVSNPNFMNSILPVESVRDFVASHFPSQIIPEVFIAVPQLFSLEVLPDGDFLQMPGLLMQHSQGPSNEIEIFMEKTWSDLFHSKAVDVDANFFELGGDSLLAIKLIFMINKHFETDLRLHVIFEKPTIRLLASEVESLLKKGAVNIRFSPVLLRQGVSAPVFFIHPIGGTIFCYESLSKMLETDRTIYAISDPGLEKSAPVFDDFKEIATFHVNMIKKIQAQGPYCLSGFSSGGNLAFEMARQLIEMGEEIECLVMLDSWAKFPVSYADKVWFNQNMMDQIRQFEQVHDSRFSLEDYPHFLDLVWDRMTFLLEHKIGEGDFPVYLFRAVEMANNIDILPDGQNYWSEHVRGKIHVFDIESSHNDILGDENIAYIAGQISKIVRLS